jgi:hypothetical protein
MKLPFEEQLKALKTERAGGSPDAIWLASTRETLMMQIGNTVGTQSRRTGIRAFTQSLSIFLPQNLGATLAVPLAALLLAVGAGASSTAIVAAAHDTLPGNTFYGVKLAAESVSLMTVGKATRAERRVEIAGRRLDEMARLSASVDADKDAKIARVAALFSNEMTAVSKDLDELQKNKDPGTVIKLAIQIESKSDEYQALFQHGMLAGRPTIRMALLSLDEVSVKALEILVEKRSFAANTLPEAQLTSAVGKKIDNFAAHVAVAEDNLNPEDTASPSMLLTTKARAAVEEAKQLLSQGDFRAAVRKVSEGTDLVSQAEGASKKPSPAPIPIPYPSTGTPTKTETSSGTPATGSATSTPPSATSVNPPAHDKGSDQPVHDSASGTDQTVPAGTTAPSQPPSY